MYVNDNNLPKCRSFPYQLTNGFCFMAPHSIMILAFLFVGTCLADVQSCALVSEQTPNEVVAGLRQTADLQVFTLQEWKARESWSETLVLDFLYDLQQSQALKEFMQCDGYIENGNHYKLDAKRLFAGLEEQHTAVASLLGLLSLSEVLIVSDPIHSVSPALAQSPSILQVSSLYISAELSPYSLELLARRVIKAKSVRTILLCVEGHLTLKLLQSLQDSQLDYPVTVLLLWEASWFDRTRTPDIPGGILFIVDFGCESAISYTDVVACRVRQRISGHSDPSFSVLQLHQGSAELVGSLNQQRLSLCLECLKWAPVPSQDTRIVTLQFSFNNGTYNPNGPTNTGEGEFYLGALLAVADINENTGLLPFSHLRVFNVSLGLTEFDSEWAKQQLAGVTTEDLGLAFLHGHYSNVALPLYPFLTSLNFTHPQIGADNSSPAFSSPTLFPHYSRVTISGAYTGVMFTRLIRHYGWTRFALLHCDDLYCTHLAKTVIGTANDTGLEIVTNASTRMLPSNMTSYPHKLLPVFQELVDSRVRITVLIMYGTTLNYCLEVLYDLGMRRGDLLFLSVMWLVPSLFEGNDESVKKRKELLNGAVQIYPGAFIGPLGSDIQTRFRQRYRVEPAHFACTNYDAVLLLAHTLDYLRTTGAVYEQSEVLNRELRKARFTGCSGDVSLFEGDRQISVFDIQNAVIQADGKVAITKVGVYSPLGTVLLSFSQNIIWPDGTLEVPGDTRLNPIDCPFEPNAMKEFWPAQVFEVACFVLFELLVIIIIGLIWHKYWRKNASALQGRIEISFEDYILFTVIGVEAVQYCYLGPVLPQWLIEADRFLVFVDWDLQRVFTMSRKLLVVGVAVSLGTVGVWICLLVAAGLRLRCGLVQLGYLLLPFLGNVCFLPIVMSLLSLFQCGQAASTSADPGFADTYLIGDCYMKCWSGVHLGLTIPALLALAVYVPSAVLLRPKWQEVQPTLHIPVSPAHLMIKSIYQLLIVSFSKILPHHNALAYSVVSLSANVHASDWLWVGLLTAGFALLLGAAEIFQFLFFPSQLYRKKGISIVDLFRFQFSKEPQAHQLFLRPSRISLACPSDVQLVINQHT